jgi:hypothetical protein
MAGPKHVDEASKEERGSSKNAGFKPSLLPIFLDLRSAQPGEAVLVDRVLPGEKFVDREHVATAGFLKGQQATAHGRDNYGFAPYDPAFRSWRRQIGDRQWAAVGSDYVLAGRSKGHRHENSHTDN